MIENIFLKIFTCRRLLAFTLVYFTLSVPILGFRYSICQFGDHETHNDHTCCKSKGKSFVIKSPFHLSEHWESCVKEPCSESESALNSAWRVYNCTLSRYLKGKSMNLRSVTEVMAKNYPFSVKTDIISKLEGVEQDEFSGGLYHKYKETNILRDAYYSVEQQVCTESAIVPRVDNEVLCDIRLEMYHRNGGCCDEYPLPFQFLYNPFRYGEDEEVDICVDDLLKSIGDPINKDLFSRARYMCYPTCEYIMAGKLANEELWEEPDMESIVERMIPTYFSANLKSQIAEYIDSQWNLVNFKELKTSYPRSIESEFSNLNKDKAQFLFRSCKVHRLIESLINDYLKLQCEQEADSQLESEFWEEFGSLIVL